MNQSERLSEGDADVLIEDRALKAQLDDALAPDQPPLDLRRKVVTAGVTQAKRSAMQPESGMRPPILARIGRSGLYAAAAAVLLVVVLGEVWWAGWMTDSIDPNGGLTVVQAPPVTNETPQHLATASGGPDPVDDSDASQQASDTQRLAATLASLNAMNSRSAMIDDQLDLLSMQVALADNENFWAEAGQPALDDAAASQQLEESFDAFDLYF